MSAARTRRGAALAIAAALAGGFFFPGNRARALAEDPPAAEPSRAPARAPVGTPASPPTGLLEPTGWRPAPADGVDLRISAARDENGAPALRLDYDFRGHAGWAAARRELALALPENYEIRFRARGVGPANHLEVKLVDESGENVWWHVLRDLVPPGQWRPFRIPKRSVRFAWGPSPAPLARISALELAITAGQGGRGTLFLSALEIVERPAERPYAGTPRASADALLPGSEAARALDGDPATAWRAAAERAALVVDFGELRTLGGLTARFLPGEAPAAWKLELSEDGASYETAIDLAASGGARNDLRLPETETRYLRLTATRAPGAAAIGLAELAVRPLEFGTTANDFVLALAREAERGVYPRAFTEGSLWTVIGSDSDAEEALVSEDGVLEAGERAFSVEPFLEAGGALLGWDDGETTRSLLDGDLPIPTVVRRFAAGELAITALATRGEGTEARIRALYRVTAPAGGALRGRFLLAVRPFQVNPPQQFLNIAGGLAPIAKIACGEEVLGRPVVVDGVPRLRAAPTPAACGVAAFAQGALAELVSAGRMPAASAVDDPQGLASAVLAWNLDLAAGEAVEIALDLPFAARALRQTPEAASPGRFSDEIAAERTAWRERLDRVQITAPAAADETLRAIRSSLAYILVHRDGAAIQPGSRAYARSWIRDGALTGSALLRLGHASEAAAFAAWFSGFQFADGKVPCCVDRRGADPVAENDSHGELIHIASETYRFTQDKNFARRLFPAVRKAVDYLEMLRQSRRTADYRAPDKRIFFGLLPQSISHEGYSAKPMHSYWDDTFADLGFVEAARLAEALGERELALIWNRRGQEFRSELLASIAAVREKSQLETLPASAELADFDSTSTTAALDPGALEEALPRGALEATFERFYRELAARRSGTAEWSGFTPYEIRHIGTFLRLGWRERANELLDYYLSVRRPAEWNQWPEAYDRDLRAMKFLGDLPHGWVASDFIRSALDLFAFERRSDRSLVLAGGIRASWLRDGDRIAVGGLATPWGALGYELERAGNRVHVKVEALSRFPEGGVVLALPGAAPVALAKLPAELDVEVTP